MSTCPVVDYKMYTDTLQVIKGFAAKSDGKDKLTALVQYLCLFLSAGQPGQLKKVQASVTAARKVFRIMRLKDALMALYFAADHVVWAHQIGLLTNKKAGERAQKVSLYSWALGSVATMVLEANTILAVSSRRRPNESDADWARRQEAARQEVNSHLLVFIHGSLQALTAIGLLQLYPFRPRTVGLLGTLASALNCYFLMPAFPQRPKAVADKPAAAAAAAAATGALPAFTGADGKLVAKVA